MYIEEYCIKKVDGMLGDRKNLLVEMTKKENESFSSENGEGKLRF